MTFFSYKQNNFKQYFSKILVKLGFAIAIGSLTTPPALAAEEIFVHYGPLEFSLSIESLKIYAMEGKMTGELASYADLLTEEQLELLRNNLTKKAEITPLSVAQFFYSYQGEKILERVGQIVETRSGQSGFYAIRSALILAAASEEGLTPLNFLEMFPLTKIRVDSAQGFEIVEELSQVIQASSKAISAVEEEFYREAITENQSIIKGTNAMGNVDSRIESLRLRDTERQRNFPVDLYLPTNSSINEPLSLIVISHGLGSDRSTFAYFAQYMASYGFAVAVPEHPGSNASQIQDLLEGFANDVTPPEEFIDRPLDITYLLDYLEANYGEQIEVRDVGIIGQSFGGYTALALAGAELNFTALDAACGKLDRSFNVSLFLQCLALELDTETVQTDLKDPRITSAIAINPLTSAIFGREGMSKIDIPVMLVSGSADPVTPALPEQIRPFTWLKTPETYFVLMKGGTHFSVLNESSGSIPIPQAAIGPDPQIGQEYIKQLGLLFFSQYYDALKPNFGCVCVNYAASISRPAMPLHLITELKEDKLELLLTNTAPFNP